MPRLPRHVLPLGLLSLLASSALTGCPDDHDAAVPSWEEFKADATRVVDGHEHYVVEWDIAVSETELRDYYDRYIAADELEAIEQESHVLSVGGSDLIWTGGTQLDLTYCIHDSFAGNKPRAIAEMAAATAAWEAVANVRFRYVPGHDGNCDGFNMAVAIPVMPWSDLGSKAPVGPVGPADQRALFINLAAYDVVNDKRPNVRSIGGFRHELGHVLGLLHEHERDDAATNSCTHHGLGSRKTTTYDRRSVMHYPTCSGVTTSDYSITPLDAAGVQALYGPPNLALGKVATQSSTPTWGGPAARAVDGRIDGDWFHNSVTHTSQEAKPWWQVDLGTVTDIGEVVIYNRTDAHGDRLSDFDVQVSNNGASWRVVASVEGKAAGRTRLAVDVAARYVRVRLRGTDYLSLAEVQVLAPYNLAAGKVASQSSTPTWGGPAARAVDGNLDGVWTHNSVTHTDQTLRAWWQVDLGVPMALGKIVLHNRTDAHSERLANFDVLVSDDGVVWTTVAGYGGVAAARTALSLATEARFVRVQLRGTDYLSLAEVQLFAPPNLARGKAASQSSVLPGTAGAGNAIDGDVGVIHPSADTGFEAAPWWQVDLGEVMDFRTIAVTPGLGGLSNFNVQVSFDGVDWVVYGEQPGFITSRETFPVVATGRYVRVERLPQSGSALTLSLLEVEVLPMQNVALGKRATQSSTPSWGGPAARAVDGNPDGDWYNGSVTHTDRQASPWWQVDLGPDTFISTVELRNRTDQWGERLANFVLEVSDDGTTWETIESHPGVAGATARFVPDVVARHLRVRLLGTDYLSLAEVEIHY